MRRLPARGRPPYNFALNMVRKDMPMPDLNRLLLWALCALSLAFGTGSLAHDTA